jgi:hypothetical protein
MAYSNLFLVIEFVLVLGIEPRGSHMCLLTSRVDLFISFGGTGA